MWEINKNEEKIRKIINENREKYVKYKDWYKVNEFSEEFINFIDWQIKEEFWNKFIWFWLFNIKEKFKWYWQIQVLTYFSRHDEFKIIDNDVIIYVIKRRINWEINHEEEIIKYLNCYLWRISNSIIFKFFSEIDINKYKSNRKLFRIILYIKRILNQCEDIEYKRQKWQEKIILWNDKWNLKNIDNELLISDYWFWKNEIWNPKINDIFDENKLNEIDFSKEVNKRYFKEHTWYYFDENWEKIETLTYYWKIANTKDAISSAYLEWYNKDTKNWRKAIENIFKAYERFNWSEDFNIDLLIKIQKVIVDWINDKLNWKNIKIDWLRNRHIWIIQTKNIWYSYFNDLIYWAPKAEHIYIMLNNLCWLFNKYVKEKIHPVIISIVISFLFVKIHPFSDWNWRTARFLQIWILRKLKYIENYHNIDLSQMIIHERKWYYNMFEKTNLPIKDKIECKKGVDNYFYNFEINYNNFSDYYWMNFLPMSEYFLDIYNKAFYLSILNHQHHLKEERLNELIKIKFWDKIKKEQKNVMNNVLKNQVKYNNNNYELWKNIRNKLWRKHEFENN